MFGGPRTKRLYYYLDLDVYCVGEGIFMGKWRSKNKVGALQFQFCAIAVWAERHAQALNPCCMCHFCEAVNVFEVMIFIDDLKFSVDEKCTKVQTNGAADEVETHKISCCLLTSVCAGSGLTPLAVICFMSAVTKCLWVLILAVYFTWGHEE